MFACFECTASSGSSDVRLSEKDTLEFLVKNSDLIVVVDIDDDSFGSFLKKIMHITASVNVKVVTVIKGLETRKVITIFAETKIASPDSIASIIKFKNGRNLMFLSKEDQSYRPTTRFSVLDIWENKVYPVWDYKDGYGTDLKEIISNIDRIKEN